MTEKIWSFAPRVLAGFALLLPIFFVPIASSPFQLSKVVLTIAAIAVLAVLFSMKTIRSGVFHFQWSLPIIGLIALPFTYALASLFSTNIAASFFGNQIDADTFGFVALSCALSIAVIAVLRDSKHVFSVLVAILVSSWIVFLFQCIQLFLGAPLSLNVFDSVVSNLVGKWNDLALFAGLIAVLSMVALEGLTLSSLHRWLLRGTLAVAMVLLTIVNFSLSWVLLGLASFGLAIYIVGQTYLHMQGTSSNRSVGRIAVPVIAILFSLFFLFAGTQTTTNIQASLGIQTLEIRPSIGGTLSVMGGVYNMNPLVGSGPNTFSDGWLLYRPTEIVATPFWNVSFNAGFGQIPTSAVTGGIVVLLGWLLFLGLFLYTALRALLTIPEAGDRSYFLVAVTALGTLYLLLANIFYVPSQSMVLLTFLFVGLFLASLRGSKYSKDIAVSFTDSPRFGFVSVLLLAVIIIVSFASLYGAGTLYVSNDAYNKAINASNNADIEGTKAALQTALAWSKQDRYYRLLSAADLASLQRLVQSGAQDKEAQDAFRDALTAAIDDSGKAVELNPRGFDNWMTRAAVYASVVPLNIQGAFENSSAALEEARLRAPTTPEIDLRLAEMRQARGERALARAAAEAALKLKADYTPAILLLAQFSFEEGKLDDAIASVRSAVYLEPQNPLLMYQLGLLELQAKNYSGAAVAFEGALKLNNDYANATFFLGEAYVYLKRPDDALAILKPLYEKNPSSEVLKSVIESIEKGQNPFASDTPITPDEKNPIE